MKKWLFILPFLALSLSFCEDAGDQESPVITINAPNEGDTASYSTPMTIDVRITDNNAIAEYTVNVRNEDFDNLTWSIFEVGLNASSLDIDTFPTFTTTTPHNYRLRVEAIDADGNNAIESVNFYAQP